MPLSPSRLVGSMGMPPVGRLRRTRPGGNPAARAHDGSSFTRRCVGNAPQDGGSGVVRAPLQP